MQVITTAFAIEEIGLKCRANSLKIGFVPTMGALHEGHLSLIDASKKENDVTISSVFVNPTQFNESVDFDKYPRQIESDLQKLEYAGVDVAFTPSTTEVYPVADTNDYQLGDIAELIEGSRRPGHFNGVASVVKRFFELIKPTRAYFGLKDYQQYLIIKNIVDFYQLNVRIVGCPILREKSGLAMSSRNQLLTPKGTEIASQISRVLRLIAEKHSEKLATELEVLGMQLLNEVPGLEPEYFLVVDKNSLMHDNSLRNNRIALVAARVEGVRLIDNMFLDN